MHGSAVEQVAAPETPKAESGEKKPSRRGSKPAAKQEAVPKTEQPAVETPNTEGGEKKPRRRRGGRGRGGAKRENVTPAAAPAAEKKTASAPAADAPKAEGGEGSARRRPRHRGGRRHRGGNSGAPKSEE